MFSGKEKDEENEGYIARETRVPCMQRLTCALQGKSGPTTQERVRDLRGLGREGEVE